MSKQTYFGNNLIASLDGGDISYNNSGTGLSATNVESAISEVNTNVKNISNDVETLQSDVETLENNSTQTIECTAEEYAAWEAAGTIDPSVIYFVTDGDGDLNAGIIVYNNTESGLESGTVQGAVDELASSVSELNSNLTSNDNTKFRFATDGEGNYGYLKADDSFVPFKRGGNFRMYGRLCGPNYNGSGAEGRIFVDVSNISKMFITNITRSGGHNWGAYGYYPDGTEEKFIANADGNITNKEYDVSKYSELKIYSVGSTSGSQGWNWIDYDISFS